MSDGGWGIIGTDSMKRPLDEELAERTKRAEEGGGEAKLARQERLGKWTARRRISELIDEGTFSEIGKHALHRFAEPHALAAHRHPGDGLICGTARIDGRRIAIIAHDPTVLRGALGLAGARKIGRLMDTAREFKLPVITLTDCEGARVAEGGDSIEAYGSVLAEHVKTQGIVTQLTLVSGLCVGGAAYSAGLMDWVAMVRDQSFMFITGAKVTRVVMGEDADMEELGGAEMHAKKTGQCHALVDDEATGTKWLKNMLGYLTPSIPSDDDPQREVPRVGSLVPEDQRKPYDVRQVIAEIFDRDSTLELSALFGGSLVTTLARLGGRAVAVVASQPLVNAGCLDIDASRKAAHFVEWAGREGLPIVTLVDVPGYLPGKRQEQGGIVPFGALVLKAYGHAKVPQICLVLRKCYGGASVLAFSSRIRLSLPTARVALMGAEAAVEVLFGAVQEGASAEEVAQRAAEKQRWLEENDHAWAPAEQGYLDDVIAPKDSRRALHIALENLVRESK